MGLGVERSQSKLFVLFCFLKALGCFYLHQKHKELSIRPVLLKKEMYMGLLA